MSNIPINEIYLDILEDLYRFGEEYSPRGSKVKELLNYSTNINPQDCVITLEGISTNLDYAKLEYNWYESGTNKISWDPKIEKIWKKYSDDGETVNSAYGYYIWNPFSLYDGAELVGNNQWNWVKQKLQIDNDTRQAVININNPTNKRIFNTKDFPCTIAIQFLIRDNKLNMTVLMRSNDIYFGFRNDIYCFSQIQIRMAKELGIETGVYTHFATSMHLYEAQFKKVEDILKREGRIE